MVARLTRLLALAFLLVASTAHAQRYNYFGPVNGILKGSVSTWQTSAAGWSDIQALLTGTCDSSHVVTGAGSCITPNAGTITGITWAVPAGFSISGSPCTSGSCSFTLSTALSGVLKGTGSGFAAAAATDVTALLNPTAHGVLFGEGTAAFTSLTMAADTVLQGTGVSSDPQAAALVNCGDTSHALSYSTTTHAFGCQALSTGGTPGGSNTQVQFNNSSVFGGASNFTYNSSTGEVSIAAPSSGSLGLTVAGLACGGTAPCMSVTSATNSVLNIIPGAAANYSQLTLKGFATSSVGFCTSDNANVCETTIPGSTLDIFNTNASGGGINFTLSTGDFSGSFVYLNQQPVIGPGTAFAMMNGSSGGCSVNTGFDHSNVASCSRSGTGVYRVTLTNGGTGGSNPACVASLFDSIGGGASVANAGSQYNLITVETYNTSGTAVDAPFSFRCD